MPVPHFILPIPDWLVVPVSGYDDDDKLGYGVGGSFQWIGHGKPYAHQVIGQIYFTTGGLQSHYLRYDAPRFAGTELRLFARLEYHAERLAPYYGEGNDTSDRPDAHAGVGGKAPYRYERSFPLARLGASIPLVGKLHAFAFANWRKVKVRAYSESLLSFERPAGVEGGGGFGGDAGLYFDLRDSEVLPTRGIYLEASARTERWGTRVPFTGLSLVEKHFVPLLEGWVLGTRLQADWLSDGAPFWEQSNFGGISPFEGQGGNMSQRGISKNRYIGRLKAIGTLELRGHFFDTTVFGQPLSVGGVGFLDVGRVWRLDGNDGSPWKIHPSWGAGLRLWRRAFVLRLDYGFSEGSWWPMPYVVFGQFF